MGQFEFDSLGPRMQGSRMIPKAKRPRDANQLAKLITSMATGEVNQPSSAADKDPAAVALGRKGGLKGGKARADSLTAKRRSEIAKKAAKKRWG